MFVASVADACWDPIALRATSNLLFTARPIQSNAPTICCTRRMPHLVGDTRRSSDLTRQSMTLTEMGWKQPPTPLQSDNSTAVGMTNRTLIPRKSKSWDLRLHWLRCRDAQAQFRFYWDKGPNNNGDYSSKHHPDIYHETKRSMGFAGCVFYPEIFI